jgi:hypothetical protein
MRTRELILALVAAAGLAGCGKPDKATDGKVAATEPNSAPAAAAPASPPKRKPGLWQQTMTADGHSMTSRVCTDEAFEQKADWAAGNAMPGACTQSVTPAAGGWRFHSECDLGSGGKSVTEGTATGDFGGRYEVKATTTVTGASVPQMNRAGEVSILAEYKGACPAGWTAGDMEIPGMGKINGAAMMKAAKAAPSK